MVAALLEADRQIVSVTEKKWNMDHERFQILMEMFGK